jgi:hypothetical protein
MDPADKPRKPEENSTRTRTRSLLRSYGLPFASDTTHLPQYTHLKMRSFLNKVVDMALGPTGDLPNASGNQVGSGQQVGSASVTVSIAFRMPSNVLM